MNKKEFQVFFQYLLPKLEDVLFITVLSMCFFLGARMLSIDSDVGRHITIGNYILETKDIPNKDILSHTKLGESRPPYEWLSQLFFAIAHKLAGLDGVILFCSIIIAFTFLLIYQETIKNNHAPLLSIGLTILGVASSSIHWLPRPHIITFVLLFIWVKQLEKFRTDSTQKIWIFPIVMLLWANLHGGFIFGFLSWFAYFAGSIWEKLTKGIESKISTLAYIGFFSLIASIITPDGWGNWIAVFSNNSQYILQNTAETMSPNFYQAGMLPFLLLLGLTIVIPLLTNTQLHAGQIFLLAGMTMMSLLMARNIPLFTVIAIPILSKCINTASLHPTLKKIETNIFSLQSQLKSQWIFIAIIFTAFFVINNYANRQTSILQFNPNVFPVQATKWLKDFPQDGNMFNEFNWGGYLEYQLYPHQKVFLDSQSDFYGEDLMLKYSQILSADSGWQDLLETYQVKWIIISPNTPLATELQTNSNWILAYQDQITVIYQKSK